MRWGGYFFSVEGRIRRRTFGGRLFALGAAFALLRAALDGVVPEGVFVVLALVVLASATTLATRRAHDRGHSACWLAWLAIPLLGPLFLAIDLFVRKGTEGENQYGDDPSRNTTDYLTVDERDLPGEAPGTHVEEVTRLYRTPVFAIARPTSIDEVREALARTNGPISIGGGRFSMGGQVASPESLHLDMRGMNRVLELSLEKKTIRVEPGVRWCDIQRVVDPHGLSVKIMQSYANFTVGGSLGVNVHGRYVGLGPLVLSVRSIAVMLADGTLVRASREENREIFFGVIGGYGALGVVVEAELSLADNDRVIEVPVKLRTEDYADHFKNKVRDAHDAVFHNADMYGPHYRSLRSVTWVKTKLPVTHGERLMPPRSIHLSQRYLTWAMSETPFRGWRREHLIDPLRFATRRVHYRNYEAGYDVRELEPPSRAQRTYVLQEYFVPVARFDEFVPKMAEILRRHAVNMLNISIRHAMPDDGTLLAWAPEEVFAFVLYYKQRTRENAKRRVAVWTRELVQAAIECGGRYYLPYQAHATDEQFHRAYPRATELFALKKKLDPDFRFRNVLWNKYYAAWLARDQAKEAAISPSEFAAVFGDVALHDGFYKFVQNIYHLYPDDRFHQLIAETTRAHDGDETIYRRIQERLSTVKPPLAPVVLPLFYQLPALRIQKDEMTRQTTELVKPIKKSIDGYVEIGTTGRYVKGLRSSLAIRGNVTLVNDVAPGNGPVDVLERGGLAKAGAFVPMGDYEPLAEAIASGSVDLVSCFIGLHHITPEKLEPFVRSIHRVLRDGGVFVLRDHDVTDVKMDRMVALAHTVFNCGLGQPWRVNADEKRFFVSVATWSERLTKWGFEDTGHRLAQANDPTKNMLMAFVKRGASA
jgi:FAD/FMN-containing dehydrogenase/uncharacterized membrane protein YhaH (DUF805 family)